MRIKVGTLRRLIREALVDHTREVPGPNSRDDAEDRLLDEDPSNYMMDDPKSIEQVTSEMKLGIAEPNPPGRYFGRRDEPEELPRGNDLPKTKSPRFEPGDDYRGWNARLPNLGNWSSDEEDTDDDLDSWTRGQRKGADTEMDPTHPPPTEIDTRLRKTLKY
jgi:hypothetical protein